MALISEAFPKLEFNTKLYWRMLEDLRDKDFEDAIVRIIKETTELYPTSNLVAIIREKAKEAPMKRIEKIMRDSFEPKQLDECAAPPKEWVELVKKVAKKRDAGV